MSGDRPRYLKQREKANGRLRPTVLAVTPDNQFYKEAALNWRKNHDITADTLTETVTIGGTIRGTLRSNAGDALRFGVVEGVLDRFNRDVEQVIDARGQTRGEPRNTLWGCLLIHNNFCITGTSGNRFGVDHNKKTICRANRTGV